MTKAKRMRGCMVVAVKCVTEREVRAGLSDCKGRYRRIVVLSVWKMCVVSNDGQTGHHVRRIITIVTYLSATSSGSVVGIVDEDSAMVVVVERGQVGVGPMAKEKREFHFGSGRRIGRDWGGKC